MASRLWGVGLLLAGCALGLGLGALIYRWNAPAGGVAFFWLVVAGGLGGLVNGIQTDGGQGKLRLPSWSQRNQESAILDLGFVAEVLVGMLGATISVLVIALIFGKDPFNGSDAVGIFRLVGFGAAAGFAARQFLPNLAKRFSEILERKVEALEAAAKVQLAREAAAQGEVLKLRTDVTRIAADSARANPVKAAATDAEAARHQDSSVEGMTSVVRAFEAITHETHKVYEDRVAAMRKVAEEMVAGVIPDAQHKDALSRKVASANEKAWVLPLATLVVANPEPGDAARLFDSYERALSDPGVREKSKFILYRVLLAITALKDSDLLPKTERSRACAIAFACREVDDDDESLKRRANAVLALLGCG